MEIFPAIDLLGGKAVRLLKGDYGRSTEYSADPEAVARTFAQCGVGYVHVVDLDGARTGEPAHLPLIGKIVKASGLKVEVLSTKAVWFGVTYKEDKDYVAGELKKLHDNGSYPPAL